MRVKLNPDKEYAVFGGWTPNPEGTTVTKDQTWIHLDGKNKVKKTIKFKK